MKKQTIAFVRDDLTGLRMLDKPSFLSFISDFGAGTKLRLTIENYSPQRSLELNGVIHWYCHDLAEECGMDMEDFKMMMKIKFLKRDALDKQGNIMYDQDTGEVLTYIEKTSKLSDAEGAKFVEQIRDFGINFLGYTLPLPDKNYKIHFLEEHKKTMK